MAKPAYPLTAIRIVLLYCSFALLWIFGSDHLLHLTVSDPQTISLLGTVKGSPLFVSVVASFTCCLPLGVNSSFLILK